MKYFIWNKSSPRHSGFQKNYLRDLNSQPLFITLSDLPNFKVLASWWILDSRHPFPFYLHNQVLLALTILFFLSRIDFTYINFDRYSFLLLSICNSPISFVLQNFALLSKVFITKMFTSEWSNFVSLKMNDHASYLPGWYPFSKLTYLRFLFFLVRKATLVIKDKYLKAFYVNFISYTSNLPSLNIMSFNRVSFETDTHFNLWSKYCICIRISPYESLSYLFFPVTF